MKKLTGLLLALVLLAAACGDDATPEAEPTPESNDATGAEESLADAVDEDADDMDADDEMDEPATEDEADPETPSLRIVSISPTATEILFAIGAGDNVVAVDGFSYFPDEAPVTELDGFSPNIEAIAAFEPTLVVMQSNGEVQAGLEALGILVIAQDGPASFDDVYAQIEQLGAATDHLGDAAELVGQMQTDIESLIASAPDVSGLSYYHELDNTLFSVTSSTFIGEVYSLFGLTNIADPADEDGSSFGFPQLSEEYIIDIDPDLIFLADTLCCGQSTASVAQRPGWDGLTAVNNGGVIELNDDIVSRWGPRLVDFVAAISDALLTVGVAA